MTSTAAAVDPFQLVSELIETGRADTVYRDIYLERAEHLLASALPLEEFRRMEPGREGIPADVVSAVDATSGFDQLALVFRARRIICARLASSSASAATTTRTT